MIETVDALDVAVATSSGFATRFDADGSFHHLFDTRTGLSAHRCVASDGGRQWLEPTTNP